MFRVPRATGVRITGWAIAVALVLAGAPVATLAQTTSGAPATQSSVDRGVTVKVTPKAIDASDGRWGESVPRTFRWQL